MTETIKERIIRTLLEKPDTTGEIAKKLGYVDTGTGKYGKYNVILPDLNSLVSEGIITGSKKKIVGAHGPPPTVYDIVYEIAIFKKIWKQFPVFQEGLQKNERILSILTQKHSWIFSISKSDLLQAKRDIEWFFHIWEYGNEPTSEFLQNNAIIEEDFNEFQKTIQKDLMSKLSQSLRFFELFLENEPDELKKVFMDHFVISERGLAYENIKKQFNIMQMNNLIEYLMHSAAVEQIFKSCVNDDVLNGYKNAEAIETIKKMNSNSPLYVNIIHAIENMKKNIDTSSADSIKRLVLTAFFEGVYPHPG